MAVTIIKYRKGGVGQWQSKHVPSVVAKLKRTLLKRRGFFTAASPAPPVVNVHAGAAMSRRRSAGKLALPRETNRDGGSL